MDYQNRPGGKTGGGGVASWTETNKDRRERLRQLALETIDLQKDPYFMKNHLGNYFCNLNNISKTEIVSNLVYF